MKNFTEWFEENKETLIKLHRNDYEEALFQAFLAGIDYGCTTLTKWSNMTNRGESSKTKYPD
jgi:hypothetical protein